MTALATSGLTEWIEGSTRSYLGQVIVEAKSRGIEAAVLGCTEIPLLMGDTDGLAGAT